MTLSSQLTICFRLTIILMNKNVQIGNMKKQMHWIINDIVQWVDN